MAASGAESSGFDAAAVEGSLLVPAACAGAGKAAEDGGRLRNESKSCVMKVREGLSSGDDIALAVVVACCFEALVYWCLEMGVPLAGCLNDRQNKVARRVDGFQVRFLRG